MEWKVIKPDVFATIMDFFTSGLPVVSEGSKQSEDTGRHNHKNHGVNIQINEFCKSEEIFVITFIFSTIR